MKRFILVIFIITLSYLQINDVQACSIIDTPYFYVKIQDLDKCSFYSENENLPDIDINEFIKARDTPKYDCTNLILNKNDQEIFRDIINQFNKGRYAFASINIEKQSDEKFLNFQKQVEKINADKCDCKRFDNVTRRDSWTVYVKSRDCRTTADCSAVPPEGCLNRILLNPIILLAIVFVSLLGALIGLIFLVKSVINKTNKRKKK